MGQMNRSRSGLEVRKWEKVLPRDIHHSQSSCVLVESSAVSSLGLGLNESCPEDSTSSALALQTAFHRLRRTVRDVTQMYQNGSPSWRGSCTSRTLDRLLPPEQLREDVPFLSRDGDQAEQKWHAKIVGRMRDVFEEGRGWPYLYPHVMMIAQGSARPGWYDSTSGLHGLI